MSLRLCVELVPRSTWFENVRKYTTKQEWDQIRKKVYAEYGWRCGICGSNGRQNCHEVWKYDDEKHIQRLEGFISLCSMFHLVKHFNFAMHLVSEGELNYAKLVAHFCKVNRCGIMTFSKHIGQEIKKYNERSQHDWTVDLGEYKYLKVNKQEAAENVSK